MLAEIAGSRAARLKQWLLWSTAALGLVGAIWVAIELTARDPSSRTSVPPPQEIILTGDGRQTSLDGLAAQLDSAREDNDQLRDQLARLEAKLLETVAGVRGAFEREIDRDRSRSAAERERERQRLDREFRGLQEGLGRADATKLEAPADALREPWPAAGQGSIAQSPPAERAPATADQPGMLEDGTRQRHDSPPPRRDGGVSAIPPQRAETGVPPLRRGDGATPPQRRRERQPEEIALATLPGSDLPDFPQAEQATRPEDDWFRDRAAPPALEAAPAAGRRGEMVGPAGQARRSIRIVGSDVPQNQPIPARANDTYRLPATSILTGTLITGLDASTASVSRRDPFPVLLRLQKTAILPNRYQADVRECFVLLAGYGDLSSERAYLRGETVACVLRDGSVLETRLQGYAAGEDGKAGVRGRLVTKQGQFIARALLVGFLQGVAEVLNRGDTITFGVSQNQNQDETNPWGSAALKGTGNALDRIAEFYIDQAYNLFPVIEIDAGRQIDIVLTGHVDMPLPNS